MVSSALRTLIVLAVVAVNEIASLQTASIGSKLPRSVLGHNFSDGLSISSAAVKDEQDEHIVGANTKWYWTTLSCSRACKEICAGSKWYQQPEMCDLAAKSTINSQAKFDEFALKVQNPDDGLGACVNYKTSDWASAPRKGINNGQVDCYYYSGSGTQTSATQSGGTLLIACDFTNGNCEPTPAPTPLPTPTPTLSPTPSPTPPTPSPTPAPTFFSMADCIVKNGWLTEDKLPQLSHADARNTIITKLNAAKPSTWSVTWLQSRTGVELQTLCSLLYEEEGRNQPTPMPTASLPINDGDSVYIQNTYSADSPPLATNTYLDACGLSAYGTGHYSVSTTNKGSTRSTVGTGIWRIEKVVSTATDVTVKHGDEVYIKNMYDTGTYLDARDLSGGVGSCAGGLAVSTNPNKDRAGVKTGTWLIERLDGAGIVMHGDTLYLKNMYTGFQSYLDVCGVSSCAGGSGFAVMTTLQQDRPGSINTTRWVFELEELPTPSPTPPTMSPTDSPTMSPTGSPTMSPTDSPTMSPTDSPTDSPTMSPTDSPTVSPTDSPTMSPTDSPTMSPTDSPTMSPTDSPTMSPTDSPATPTPTASPTPSPMQSPSTQSAANTGTSTPTPTDSPATPTPTASPTCASGTCTIVEDPHVNVFDGVQISLLSAWSPARRASKDMVADTTAVNVSDAAGDMWVVKNKDVFVQARFLPDDDLSPEKVFVRSLAVGGPFLRNKTLIIGALSDKIMWNGEEILSEQESSFESLGRMKARRHFASHDVEDASVIRHGVDFELPLGVNITVNRQQRHINLAITMTPLEGGQDGLCGNFNGVGSDDTFELIKQRDAHVEFAESIFESAGVAA